MPEHPGGQTSAYLAGAGLNGVVPARAGDLAKLHLIRQRAPDARWSTLAATFVPETLFETAVGVGLVVWAISQGLLPVPVAPSEIPAVDVSLFMRYPVLSTAGAVLIACSACWLCASCARGRATWDAACVAGWSSSVVRAISSAVW